MKHKEKTVEETINPPKHITPESLAKEARRFREYLQRKYEDREIVALVRAAAMGRDPVAFLLGMIAGESVEAHP